MQKAEQKAFVRHMIIKMYAMGDSMEQGRILPFYMTYPLPLYYEEEKEVVKDMEYLQSHRSVELKSIQKEIADIINILDYSGSMIYDEYPDRFSLERQSKSICEQLRKKYHDKTDCIFYEMMSWDGFSDIVMLLMYDEILKRRHCKTKGYLRF